MREQRRRAEIMENDARESGKPKTRSPGLERFNKWTGRVFSGALLLAALIFEVPWKLTLVLPHAFASSVELIPSSVTKSRWTRVFLILTVLVAWPVWLLLPANPGDYRPFMFAEERARLEQEYAVPADQNASAVYMRLLEESDPNDRTLPSWMGESQKAVLRRPWKPAEYPEIARWLDERQGMIEALKSLSAYRQCRFLTEPVLQTSEPPNPRWKAARAWAYMLTMAANLKAGEGDVAGALQLHALNLKMADHHLQQLDMIDYVIGLAVEKMALNALSGLAVEGTPTADELATMDALTATPSHDWTSTWCTIMKFECLLVKNTCCRAVYEVNAKGKIRYSRSSFADYKGIKSSYQRSVNGKLLASAMWVVFPKSPWKFARRIDERYARFSQIGQPDIDAQSPGANHHTRFRANHEYVLDRFMDIVEPAYHKVSDIHTRSVATRRACRVILLLRQHRDETGEWPASLDEVAAGGGPELWTDPLNGGPFIYKPEGQAFRLYSKGRNGVDENGKWRSEAGDDWPIWPPRGRMAEAEQPDVNEP
jgi:hypothetical protein